MKDKILQKLNYMDNKTALNLILSSMNPKYIGLFTNYFDNFSIYSYSKESIADFIIDLYNKGYIDINVFLNYYPEKDIIDKNVLERYSFLKFANSLEKEILRKSGMYVYLTTVYNSKGDIVMKDTKSLYDYLKNIKSNSENCKKCTLRSCDFVNIDVSRVVNNECDVLFVGEAPGEEEIKEGKPFVGKSGQLLRSYISRLPENVSYAIANTCLCRPPNNRTPYPTEIEYCLPNLITIIETLNPKVIVAVGSTAYKALTFTHRDKKQKQMSEVRGFTAKFKDIPIFTIYHPSYILRSNNKAYYEEDFFKLKNFIQDILEKTTYNTTLLDNQVLFRDVYRRVDYNIKGNLCFVKLQDKLYNTDEYRLLNIERYENYILYTFKNEKLKKTEYVIHDIPSYFYSSNVRRYHLDSDNAVLHFKDDQTVKKYTYERYLNPMTKCYTDYKLQCKDTNVISSYDYCVLDIEILAEGDEFPDQIAAKFPVNLVSIYSSIDGKIHTYVMDKENIYKDETIDVINSDNETISSFDVVYHYFTNEKELLSSVMSHVRKHDVVLAWNIIFDMPYIYNRMKNLGMDADSEFTKVKPFKPVFDMQYKSISIPGLIPIDALSLYKSLTYADGEKESYKLDYIASIELNSRKTSSGKHFYKLWEESRKDACYYNQIDVALTKLILDKYYAIDFNNQLRHLYGVNWNMVESISFGVESMLYYLMKSKGQIFIDKDKNGSVSGTYEGAFIHEPLKGIRFISTFDFSSLYPSIMITCNIDNDLLKGKILTVEDFSKYMMYRLYGKNGDEYISVYIVNENLDKIQTSIPISDFHEYVKDCVMTFNGCFFKKDTKSIVAELEEILLGRRKQYKKLYEENGSISDYVKQWAYKIAANSVYGYLGFEKSTLYDKDLAEAVTKTGQVLNKYCSLLYEYDFEKDDKEILDIIFTKYPTVNHQLDRKKVVYGDTDSIMITIDQDSNIDELVSKLESRFNERLKSLGIQIVNSNNPVWKLSYEKTGYILPVTKKRYALYQIHPKEKMIIKGLEVRKVNYPQLLREGYTNVLYMLLRDRKPINEIQEYIRQVDREFRNRYKNLDLATGVPVVWNSSKETYKVANPSIKGMLLFNSLVRKVFTPGSRGYLFDIKFNPLTPISRQAQIAYAKELGQLVGKVNTEKEIKQIQFIVLPYDLIEDDISKLNEMISKKIIIPMSDNTIKTYWYGKLADFGIQI